MASVNLYLDKRYVSKGAAVLKLQIYHNGTQRLLPTGYRIPPEAWDPGTCTVIGGKDASRTNTLVSMVLNKARNRVGLLQITGGLEGMTADELREDLAADVLGKEPRKVAANRFLARMEAYRDSREKAGTRETYDRTVKALLRFDRKVGQLSFDDIDRHYLERFNEFCLETMKVNSVSILMRCIRKVFNEALDDEITRNYPFRKFKIRQEATRKRALKVEQLRTLATMELEPWHEEYRDMFLLMFYLIGINSVDLFSLKKGAYVDGRIEYRRHKTGKLYSVKVEPEADVLIRKYAGKDHLLRQMDHLADIRSYRLRMNKNLKQMGRATGKKGKVLGPGLFPELSTYWARHTWSTIARSIGISVDTIAQAFGHTDKGHAVTMIYIDPDPQLVDDANRKVIDYLMEGISAELPQNFRRTSAELPQINTH